MGFRSAGRFLVGTGAFVATGVALLRLGRLQWLTVDWSDPLDWLDRTETESALAALARLAGLALMGWIGVTTVVYAVARFLGMDRRSIGWLSIGPVRRAVDALLAGYLAFGSMVPVRASVEALPEPPPVATSGASVDPGYVPVPAGTPDPERVADETQSEAEGTEPAQNPKERLRVVERGDHLWKLAAEHLAEGLGRSPRDAEIGPYWLKVIEANRDRIRSGDPDLIFPGEQIVLPPPPTEPMPES